MCSLYECARKMRCEQHSKRKNTLCCDYRTHKLSPLHFQSLQIIQFFIFFQIFKISNLVHFGCNMGWFIGFECCASTQHREARTCHFTFHQNCFLKNLSPTFWSKHEDMREHVPIPPPLASKYTTRSKHWREPLDSFHIGPLAPPLPIIDVI